MQLLGGRGIRRGNPGEGSKKEGANQAGKKKEKKWYFLQSWALVEWVAKRGCEWYVMQEERVWVEPQYRQILSTILSLTVLSSYLYSGIMIALKGKKSKNSNDGTA
jgi:hypothetical protein